MHDDKIYIERDPSMPWKKGRRVRVRMPWAVAEALEHGLKKAEEKYGLSSPEAEAIRSMIPILQ